MKLRLLIFVIGILTIWFVNIYRETSAHSDIELSYYDTVVSPSQTPAVTATDIPLPISTFLSLDTKLSDIENTSVSAIEATSSPTPTPSPTPVASVVSKVYTRLSIEDDFNYQAVPSSIWLQNESSKWSVSNHEMFGSSISKFSNRALITLHPKYYEEYTNYMATVDVFPKFQFTSQENKGYYGSGGFFIGNPELTEVGTTKNEAKALMAPNMLVYPVESKSTLTLKRIGEQVELYKNNELVTKTTLLPRTGESFGLCISTNPVSFSNFKFYILK